MVIGAHASVLKRRDPHRPSETSTSASQRGHWPFSVEMAVPLYSQSMGRVWNLLNQDANKAIDRMLAPYDRFVHSHRRTMWLANATLIALVWILVSQTLALLIVGLWVVLLLYGVARVLWLRRRFRQTP